MAGTTGKTWILPKRAGGTLYMSDVVPVLTNPDVPPATVTMTTAVARVQVTTPRGTLYFVVTTTNQFPSAGNIKLGQNASGIAVVTGRSGNQAITSAGLKQFSITNLVANVTYYVYIVQSDGTFDSNVTQVSFLTLAAATNPSWQVIPNVTADRTLPFPQTVLSNVRTTFLSDPSLLVTGVTLQNAQDANFVYDSANDRLRVLADPGAGWQDVVLMRAATASLGNFDSNSFTGQSIGTAAQAVRWNPGHYVGAQGVMTGPDTSPPNQAGYSQAQITEIGGMVSVKGFEALVDWACIEPITEGVYVWTQLDALFNALKAVNRRLIVHMLPDTMGSAATWKYPRYIRNAPAGQYLYYMPVNSATNKEGWTFQWWVPSAVQKYINAMKALLTRYGDDPMFEALRPKTETDIGAGTLTSPSNPPGYTVQGYYDGQSALLEQCIAHKPSVNIWIGTSYGPGGPSKMMTTIPDLINKRVMIGGQDCHPDQPTYGDHVTFGDSWNGSAWVVGGGTDYRGRTGSCVQHSIAAMGGKDGHVLPARAADYAINRLGATHMCWIYKNFFNNTGHYPAEQQIYWADGTVAGQIYTGTDTIKGYLNGSPLPTKQTYPQVYSGAPPPPAGTTHSVSNVTQLTAANTNAVAGDTVEFATGTYNGGMIAPARSGTSGAPITYRPAAGATVTLTGVSGINGIVRLAGRSYITVSGLRFNGTNLWPSATIDRFVNTDVLSSNYIIEDCTFTRANGFTGVQLDGTNWIFRRNSVTEVGFYNDGAGGETGDGVAIHGTATNFLFELNTITKCGHVCLDCRGYYPGVVQDNIISNDWGGGAGSSCAEVRARDAQTIDPPFGRVLFQRNTIGPAGTSVLGPQTLLSVRGKNQIVRFNTVAGTSGKAVQSNTIANFTKAQGARIYNNQFTGLGGDSVWFIRDAVTGVLEDNEFKNNAIGTIPGNVYLLSRISAGTQTGDQWNNNRWIGNSFQGTTINFTEEDIDTYTLAEAQTDFPATFNNNQLGQLVRSNGGRNLTTVTSATGSGTAFTVGDAGYFWAGDSIRVGSATTTIVAVNYATNVITASASFNWTNGAGVNIASMMSGNNITTGVPGATPPSTAPTLVSARFNSANAQNVTAQVSLLTGYAAGQGLVMIVSSVGTITTPPVGWALIGSILQSGTNVKAHIYLMTAPATATDVPIAHTGGRINVWTMNWANFSALDAVPQFSLPYPNFTAPGITPTQNNCTVITAFATQDNPVTYNTPPDGFTLAGQSANSAGFMWLGVAYQRQTDAAATGTLTWDIGVNQGGQKVGMTFALRGA